MKQNKKFLILAFIRLNLFAAIILMFAANTHYIKLMTSKYFFSFFVHIREQL